MKPIVLYGKDGSKSCHIENPLFLAPMEGVTDIGFRQCVDACGGVGVMSTQFIRISGNALPKKVFQREIGDIVESCPLGVQLMAADTAYVAEAAGTVENTRAQFLDFNFGCPVKRVFNKCAGSAMLQYPQRMHDIVATAVAATQLPVTAKIRAGVEDPGLLAEILHALADAGATMICIHARLRIESYAMDAHWDWIAQAVEILDCRSEKIPLIGNGGVDTAEDIQRMHEHSQCAGVMIGRAALANPFIFSQYGHLREQISKPEAAQFIADYWAHMNHPKKSGLGKIKQLLKYYQAGDLISDEQRQTLLRASSMEVVANMLNPWLKQPMLVG
ncbi:MAG: tRNA-dihydrouridine synthase family protein [Planctomycetes bacterium]|nr:tRNA-dihydrouridine synthase family protein [Planctomycetota bacterium]